MNTTGLYPRPHVDVAPVSAVGQAGGMLLTETVRATGLVAELSRALAPWRKQFSRHDPGKILTDLALMLAVCGDCLADVATLRAEPDVYGPVASDPTISRLLTTLAGDVDKVEQAISGARRRARKNAWALAGDHAPGAGATAKNPLVIDLDASLVTSHSEKEFARPTFKKGFGFHPLLAFVDHGTDGSGEMLTCLLRPGNAGSNTAADHKSVIADALTQVGMGSRPGRKVLVRIDGAGGTKKTLQELVKRRVSYSVGFTLPANTPELFGLIPKHVWEPAYNSDGEVREGADVAELTRLLDLDEDWPEGMRVIVRRERPHPGAQLRFDDVDGYRLTAFATNTTQGQLADLEVRHRRRARCEDRIRVAKDMGLRNLPLTSFAQNRIWCQIVALASEITAWMGLLGYADQPARRWEPKRLRHRLFQIPAAIARHARQRVLHLSDRSIWAGIVQAGHARLADLRAPAG
ncbi:IS1380 family transposase [Brachybacterium paraconglomeratum]|uniref:IS1380 family transposase n=1 Tax=Brachybacterium paraconglomeratum TaxID=173362 RepID=UPI002FD80693